MKLKYIKELEDNKCAAHVMFENIKYEMQMKGTITVLAYLCSMETSESIVISKGIKLYLWHLTMEKNPLL